MDAPLAERLRPQNLDEFLGQNKILGQQSLLRKSLENDSIPSMIFWGPPGCGKSSSIPRSVLSRSRQLQAA